MTVSNELVSRVTGQPVIGGMLALRKPDGSFDGTVAIALDVHWIDYMCAPARCPRARWWRYSTAAARSSPPTIRTWPRAIARAALKAGGPTASGRHRLRGNLWHFATAALIGNNIFVAFAMPESRLFGPTYLHVGIDFLLPILMILFAWIAIWLATDRQVTHWITICAASQPPIAAAIIPSVPTSPRRRPNSSCWAMP